MDDFGLVITIVFVIGALLIIPLNQWLDRRAQKRRRMMAHQRRKARW